MRTYNYLDIQNHMEKIVEISNSPNLKSEDFMLPDILINVNYDSNHYWRIYSFTQDI
jgi:disulfide oxidoreductase YuzD